MPLILRFAFRELRAGTRGFAVFLACLALGVAAIAGVGSVSRALTDGLAHEGRTINGGDIAFSLIGREASPAEQAFLAHEGRLSTVATLRAIARTADGRSTLVEIKAVDGAYPLSGDAVLAGGAALQPALAAAESTHPAVADPALFARLDLKAGDVVTIGTLPVALAGTLTSEPDKLAGGIGFGPRLMMSLDTLHATGLILPGALIRWNYRLALPAEADLKAVENRANAAFPQAGWEIRTRDNASPELGRSIDRFTMFLTLVGLTALAVGGVGVANAVRAFVEGKRDTIATLKTLGAPGSTVFTIYLAQTMLLGFAGIVIGLVAGAALPFVLAATVGQYLPIPVEPALYPRELVLAFAYGLLTALAFALWPLGRTHDVAVSALFRDAIDPQRRLPRRRYIVFTAVAAAALAGLAIVFANDRQLAVFYVLATLACFVVLRLVALALMAGARRLPRPRSTELRLALSNIHRPGALTPSVVLSLGLGLCLLVTLALIDGNIRRQLSAAIPDKAPSFFFVDIQHAEAGHFGAFIARSAPGAKLDEVPMLRGRIIALKGVKAQDLKPPSNVAWALSGDRGITFADTVPGGSTLVEGSWWPAGYAGKPLVSIESSIAEGFGLHIGDAVTVNVLGRNIDATIANIRKVEWDNFGINFVLVFSPSTFRGAPATDLATLTYPGGSSVETEVALLRNVAAAFPTVTAVRVKDALDAIGTLATELALGIRGAASIALLASMLVLAGALAAGRRARTYDAVVLKVLGATRRRLLVAFLLEYGALGLATAAFGLGVGTLAAWWIVEHMMEFDFVFIPSVAIAAAFGAMAVTILFGLAGTWRILGLKPAPYLREL